MASVVDESPIYSFYSTLVSDKSLPINSELHHEDGQFLEPLNDRSQSSSYLIDGNVRSDAPIVIWFGHQESTLRRKLIRYLAAHDIVLRPFFNEEYLWQWLNLNSSLTIASFILQPTMNSQQLIARSHSYTNIRSILVHCTTAEMINLDRFSRTYPKVDGIYNDDKRLLCKLMFDLIFLSEEQGDHYKEDKNNEMEAQRNYDRALKLCALVKTV